MSHPNDGAGAAAETATAGPNRECLEGPSNTKTKPDHATVIAALADLYPAAFVRERWQSHKPLKAGIHHDLIAAGIVTAAEVSPAMRWYCGRRTYQVALAAGGPRYDLDGVPCGEVSAEQARSAQLLVEHMDRKTAETAAKARAEQKAVWLAEKAKRAAAEARSEPKRPKPYHSGRHEIIAPRPPQTVDPAAPKRLGLAGLKAAAQARKAAAAIGGV
jgi:sRNA-binding protein